MNNNDITVKLGKENKKDRMSLQGFLDNTCKIDFFSDVKTYESYPYTTVSDKGEWIHGKEKIIFAHWADGDNELPVHHKHSYSISSDDIYTNDERYLVNDYLEESIKPFREKINLFVKSGKFKDVTGYEPSDFYIKFFRGCNVLLEDMDYFKSKYRLGIELSLNSSRTPDYTIVYSEYKFSVFKCYLGCVSECLYEE